MVFSDRRDAKQTAGQRILVTVAIMRLLRSAYNAGPIQGCLSNKTELA